MRRYSLIDQYLSRFDRTLNAFFQAPESAEFPGAEHTSDSPDPKTTISLMRINHCGEVCAQALYLGQALVAKNESLANTLYESALEEKNHLRWCANRIEELNGHVSIFNPLFAIGSFGIGVCAGLYSDQISLSFLAETERQVSHHLQKHLSVIPDRKSQAILLQMLHDETQHEHTAKELGGSNLPDFVCFSMKMMGKVMTTTTRYL